MEFISLLGPIPYLQLSLIDATLMMLLATPLLYFLSLRPLIKVISERDAEIAQRKQIEAILRNQTTALEAAANGVFVTDRQGKIIWANQAFSKRTGYSLNEVLRSTPKVLKSGANNANFEGECWETILSGKVWEGEITNRSKTGELYIDIQTITPVFNSSGEIENFIAIQQDITERKRIERIMRTRLRLMQVANVHGLDELLQQTLDEIESLTNSKIGFFHFLEPDEKTLTLRAWSTHTLQNMCTAEGKGSHYDVGEAGVWADCVRQRKPVIHNNYESLQDRKGLPEGHAPLMRELTVPILRNEKVVAILGMGNKPLDYTAIDVEVISSIADFAWDIIERRRNEDALVESEEKFHTFTDWTYDWEKWMDPQNNIVYTSPSCGRITGFSPEEFMADPDLLLRIVHPDDRQFYEEHHKVIHNESEGPLNIEYRIIAKDGSEHWIEHICRPLYGKDNRYLGRRVSNRDVTERKQADEEIRARDRKENMLTNTIHTMQMDIARDLHDTVGQNISFLRLKLDYMVEKDLLSDTDLSQDIKRMSSVANDSYDLMRGTLAVLQSEDSADLAHLFARYAAQIEERTAFKINFNHTGIPQFLSATQMRQLFYVYREILNNIEKHANATSVSIELSWNEDHLAMIVSDNGRGFDIVNHNQSGANYGLKFMRDRVEIMNGTLVINSVPGSGTNIIIRVPFENIA
ncbi:MAG: PAS domain S-box protein [Chloroflexi bacterium]|nr:PAS domain S-box protein [Chloroflexota bacterium]